MVSSNGGAYMTYDANNNNGPQEQQRSFQAARQQQRAAAYQIPSYSGAVGIGNSPRSETAVQPQHPQHPQQHAMHSQHLQPQPQPQPQPQAQRMIYEGYAPPPPPPSNPSPAPSATACDISNPLTVPCLVIYSHLKDCPLCRQAIQGSLFMQDATESKNDRGRLKNVIIAILVICSVILGIQVYQHFRQYPMKWWNNHINHINAHGNDHTNGHGNMMVNAKHPPGPHHPHPHPYGTFNPSKPIS